METEETKEQLPMTEAEAESLFYETPMPDMDKAAKPDESEVPPETDASSEEFTGETEVDMEAVKPEPEPDPAAEWQAKLDASEKRANDLMAALNSVLEKQATKEPEKVDAPEDLMIQELETKDPALLKALERIAQRTLEGQIGMPVQDFVAQQKALKWQLDVTRGVPTKEGFVKGHQDFEEVTSTPEFAEFAKKMLPHDPHGRNLDPLQTIQFISAFKAQKGLEKQKDAKAKMAEKAADLVDIAAGAIAPGTHQVPGKKRELTDKELFEQGWDEKS
jgi:hypothetical protein